MDLIKGGLFIFLLFDIFVVGLTPGHTWILIIFAIFILMWVFGKTKLFTLGVLLLLMLVLFAGGSASDLIEAAGRRLLSQRIFNAANQHITKSAEHKDPTSALRQGTQIASQEDLQTLNACLQQVAHKYSQDASKGGAGEHDLVANEAKFCAGKAGSDFTTCMNKNVFNGTNADADVAADQCGGASNGAFGITQDKIQTEGEGVAIAVACTGVELVNTVSGFMNTIFGWAGVDLPTKSPRMCLG
jgi:hypothetical protein